MAETYRGWLIECDPKPIPDRRYDWDYWDPDDDGVAYTAESREAAMDAIDEIIELADPDESTLERRLFDAREARAIKSWSW